MTFAYDDTDETVLRTDSEVGTAAEVGWLTVRQFSIRYDSGSHIMVMLLSDSMPVWHVLINDFRLFRRADQSSPLCVYM